MIFRFTLYHSIAGSKVIAEPDGWKNAIAGLERHPDFHSLVEYYRSGFSAYGSNGVEDGGRDWIKEIETTYGADEEIEVTVEYAEDEYNPTWLLFFEGITELENLVEVLDFDHQLQLSFTNTAFWSKFISRFTTPVDILSPTDLDGNARSVLTPTLLNLPSQTIRKKTVFKGSNGNEDTIKPVKAATTGPVILSGIQTIDGVTFFTNERVLVKDQIDQTENGTYLQKPGAWVRTSDADTPLELENGTVYVENGTVNADTRWRQTTTPVVVGSSNIVWVPYNATEDVVLLDAPEGRDRTDDLIIHFPVAINPDQKEIEDSFTVHLIATRENESTPIADYFEPNIIEIKDESGIVGLSWNIDFYLNHDFLVSGSPLSYEITYTVYLYKKIDDEEPEQIDGYTQVRTFVPGSAESLLEFNMSGSTAVVAEPSTRITLFAVFRAQTTDWDGSFFFFSDKIYGGIVRENVTFSFFSEYPTTQSEGFFQHDVFGAIVDRITGTDLRFYSDLLGSPDTRYRQYDTVGEHANYMLFKFLQLRQYPLSEKPFFQSAQDWWEGANPIFNLGLGYEIVDGVERIRVEKKKYFYDDSSTSVNLSNVRKIRRFYDSEHIFNAVEIGSEQWESEDVSGIDDPQSKRTWATYFKHIGKKLSILSKWIAASLTIESARRTTREKSTDYKYDNDVAIISVVNSNGDYIPETSEGFTGVSNLNDAATRINRRLTPARALLRWIDYLSGPLQKNLSSVFKFVSGEGNFAMKSTMIDNNTPEDYEGVELAENGNISVSEDFLFIPMPFEIEHYLTMTEYKSIVNNRNLAIGISQTETNHKKFFIKDLQYEIVSGTVKIIAWPKEPFDIQVIDDGVMDREVIPEYDRRFDDTFNETYN
jgi:hypothetical protein